MSTPRAVNNSDTSTRGLKFIRKLGNGAYGEAWLVDDLIGRQLVVKRVALHGTTDKQKKAALSEARILNSLRHEFICRFHNSFVSRGTLSIVMEYYSGGDLSNKIKERLSEKRIFSERSVMRWFSHISLAMQYLHSKHVIHRDVKPQNIFLTSDCSEAKLGDFGVSRELAATDARALTRIGTPYYISPQICAGKSYSYGSDIWSMGCLLFELTTLRHPFDGSNIPVIMNKILNSPPPNIPSTWSSEIRTLCKKCLSKLEHRRPTINQIVGSQLVSEAIKEHEDCKHIAERKLMESKIDVNSQIGSTEKFRMSSENMKMKIQNNERQKDDSLVNKNINDNTYDDIDRLSNENHKEPSIHKSECEMENNKNYRSNQPKEKTARGRKTGRKENLKRSSGCQDKTPKVKHRSVSPRREFRKLTPSQNNIKEPIMKDPFLIDPFFVPKLRISTPRCRTPSPMQNKESPFGIHPRPFLSPRWRN